ncbi:hypothetical protein C8J57DRAFT_1717255 [Mycena rebaudengoi]|nr:hypothetical protein C8J57DRAFT_1717255 [Mycena rebaudengoi]
MLHGICELSFLREMESRQKDPISTQCANYSNPPQSTAQTRNRKEMVLRTGAHPPAYSAHRSSSPCTITPLHRFTLRLPLRLHLPPPRSLHVALPPIPRAGVPSRRVVHRTPPPYAITGTTTTATSVLVQATYNPSSTSYPATSTSSTTAYPSSAYPTSTYPVTTRSSNSTPRSSSRPPLPPLPTTLKAQESTLPPPPPARHLHPLDPAFSGDKRGAAVSDVDKLATPSVRHYACTQGVDLAQIAPGTGNGGRVERTDVGAFLAAGASPSEGSAPSAPRNEKDVLVELGCTRQAMWRAMEKSLEIPHFGYSATLDITELHALLLLLNANIPAHYLPSSSNSSTDTSPARLSPAEQSALSLGLTLPTPAVTAAARYTRLTYLPFLLKSLARTMMDWPLFRASIAPTPSPSTPSTPTPKSTSRHLTIRPHADIALALLHALGPLHLRPARRRHAHAQRARLADRRACGAGARRAPCAHAQAPRGAGRGRWASPVLVPGGGIAIVALGRAEWVWDVSGEYPRARADGAGGYGDGYGAFEGQRRLKLNVSWAADHRVVEGAEMAAFVESWRGWGGGPGAGARGGGVVG